MMKKYTITHCLGILVLVFFMQGIRAQEYFQPISMEGVNLKGTITEAVINKISVMDPGLYIFPYEHKFEPLPNDRILPIKVSGGTTYHDGKIYCNIYDDSRNLPEQIPHWTIYNAKTFEVLKDIELESGCKATTKTLTYDVTTDQIFGIVETFTEFFFVSINPETGDMKQIGERMGIDKKFVSLACSNEGVLYTIYSYNGAFYLAKVRKSDGKIANVGVIEPKNLMKNDLMINFAYDQSLFFNTATGKLYWIFGSSSIYLEMEYTAIMEVDTQLATATLVSYIPKLLHVSGAYLEEPVFSAPRIVEDFRFITSSEGALDGILSMRLPEKDYGGDMLQGTLTVVVEENGKELIRLEGKPGEEISSQNLSLDAEQHKVFITVYNEQAEPGPTIARDFFVGYDVPKACTNIELTSIGLKTTLSWDPPTEGMHGEAINPETYTYKVVRYPNEVTVLENTKERTFTEEHPEEMTRYVYLVVPIDGSGREGQPAFSNNLIVGTPLDVPFGGAFKNAADLFNYYTIIDNNKDGISWSYDETKNYAFYTFNPFEDADDWLISPQINYEKGKTYVLRFKTFSLDGNYPEAMEVMWGDERYPERMFVNLLYLPEVPAMTESQEGTEYNLEITANYDGIYHFGFHVISPAYSGNLYLYDIDITEKGASSLEELVGVDDILVTIDKGQVTIDNPKRYEIALYSCLGECLEVSDDSIIHRNLCAGTYIVNFNGGCKKFVIC